MKKYPMNIENWGDDRYMLVSRGHHDIELFKQKCREEYRDHSEYLDHYKSPCEQYWVKAVPRDGYKSFYVPIAQGARGAFPVTAWWG